MARRAAIFTWSYADLCELTGKSLQAVYEARSSGDFDPEVFATVIKWVTRHATPAFKIELMTFATQHFLTEQLGTPRRPKKP